MQREPLQVQGQVLIDCEAFASSLACRLSGIASTTRFFLSFASYRLSVEDLIAQMNRFQTARHYASMPSSPKVFGRTFAPLSGKERGFRLQNALQPWNTTNVHTINV